MEKKDTENLIESLEINKDPINSEKTGCNSFFQKKRNT